MRFFGVAATLALIGLSLPAIAQNTDPAATGAIIQSNQATTNSSPAPQPAPLIPGHPNTKVMLAPVPGQAPLSEPQSSAPPTPDHVTYRFFFAVMAGLEDVAAKMEAAGKDGSKVRTHHQQAAKLSEDEGKIVTQVEHDCNDAVKQIDAKIKAVVTAFQNQYPNRDFRSTPKPPELYQLFDQRKQTITDHIDKLRSLLGNDSFQKLDDYVKKNFKSTTVQLPNPASPPAAAAKAPGGGQ